MSSESSEALQKVVSGVLSGNRLMLARAITQIENEAPAARQLLRALFFHAGQAHIIGITGAPGTGKSTLVTELARAFRTLGKSVAIVAVDPTSPFTGGALLGDRVRMRTLSGDPGLFIRSMATRGNLGGLSKTTNDVITVLDAAGFERILVETVGVGQAEVEIATTAHTTVVVEAPGLGDEIQAIKAGVLEIADILVVNKADRPGVDATVRALEMTLGHPMRHPVQHHGQTMTPVKGADADVETANWTVQVFKTIASAGDGINALRDQIEAHAQWLEESGQGAVRAQANAARHLMNILYAELSRRIRDDLPFNTLEQLSEQISKRQVEPYEAAETLLTLTSLLPRA